MPSVVSSTSLCTCVSEIETGDHLSQGGRCHLGNMQHDPVSGRKGRGNLRLSERGNTVLTCIAFKAPFPCLFYQACRMLWL